MQASQAEERKEVLKDFFGGREEDEVSEDLLTHLIQFEELMLKYRSAIREVTTKLEILNDELSAHTERNPIENIQSRLKRPYSIARKLNRLQKPVTVEAISQNLNDVAGIRVICPFIDNIYEVAQMLLKQDDVRLIASKDYIQNPKPNGYRSLHLILKVLIFLSESTRPVRIELQLRTIAMDFWASLEHQLRYKSDIEIPPQTSDDLKACADVIAATDEEMQRIAKELHVLE